MASSAAPCSRRPRRPQYSRTPEGLDRIYHLVKSPALEINFDTGNAYLCGHDVYDWLERVAGLYAADDPLHALRTLSTWAAERSEDWTVLADDLITRRNEHLLTRLDEALVEYERIIVPWGALHLPGIASAIIQRGFERTQEARHRVLTWRGIARRLLDTR